MNRIDAMLQPGETVVWCNQPGLGFGSSPLIGLGVVAAIVAGMVWMGGGWESLWDDPRQLVPLAALLFLFIFVRSWDEVAVTERRLLITRGLLRRDVVEVNRADILSAAVTKSVPAFGKVVIVRCRRGAARLYRFGTAGAAAFGHDEIGTVLSDGADALCAALDRPDSPRDDSGARGRA